MIVPVTRNCMGNDSLHTSPGRAPKVKGEPSRKQKVVNSMETFNKYSSWTSSFLGEEESPH
jgi:hypothetical protein